MMESHHFNTYSSAKYSNDKRTLYLALNKKGIPRKVQTKAKASLGKMETYTNVLTKPVSIERVESLAVKVAKARVLLGKLLQGTSGEEGFGERNHLVRHHRYQFCPNVPMTKLDDKNKFRCRKKEKRKKKRNKCKNDNDDDDDDECLQTATKKKGTITTITTTTITKCDDDEDDEDCQKRLHGVRQKRKSRNGSDTDAEKCTQAGKCTDDKEKRKKKKVKGEKKKISGKTLLKIKCNSEIINCNKKKGNSKGNNLKERKKSSSFSTSGEDFSSTTSLLWKEILTENIKRNNDNYHVSPIENFPQTEKSSLIDEYEEEEDEENQTEKLTEIDDESSSEIGYDWVTQSPSSPSSSSSSSATFNRY